MTYIEIILLILQYSDKRLFQTEIATSLSMTLSSNRWITNQKALSNYMPVIGVGRLPEKKLVHPYYGD